MGMIGKLFYKQYLYQMYTPMPLMLLYPNDLGRQSEHQKLLLCPLQEILWSLKFMQVADHPEAVAAALSLCAEGPWRQWLMD